MMKKRLLPIILGVVMLSACATTQAPAPVVSAPVNEAPAPVFIPEPEPIEQAEIAPLPDTNAPIPGSKADFAYRVRNERVFFGYDQFQLTSEARDVLRAHATWLNNYPTVNAIIAGNADERGTREYNLALGSRRADSVKAFLVAQGVSPNRLTTVSYGKERPIDARSNEAGWALNRNGYTNIVSGAIG